MRSKKNTTEPKIRQRPKAESARTHHLFVDVTAKEKRLIQSYCDARNISVSEFLAEVALKDAGEPAPKKDHQRRQIVIELDEHDYAKLMYKSRLREVSPQNFVQTRLLHGLQKSKEWGSLDVESLRYYVSGKEHKTLLDHLKKHGHSSRHYVAFLALRAIEQQMNPIKDRLLKKERS